MVQNKNVESVSTDTRVDTTYASSIKEAVLGIRNLLNKGFSIAWGTSLNWCTIGDQTFNI